MTQRAAKSARGRSPAAARRGQLREERLIVEIGGGLGDLYMGAVHQERPTLTWTDDVARSLLVATRVQAGVRLSPAFALVTAPSSITREALAVWAPLALHHLLSLDPSPPIKLVEARRFCREADEYLRRWGQIRARIAAAIDAIDDASRDATVWRFMQTAAHLRRTAAFRSTGEWPRENMLLPDDGHSDRDSTLHQARYILQGLLFDARSVHDGARRQAGHAEDQVRSITGAKSWTRPQSLRVSRRLTTLVDALRAAYGPRSWSPVRVSELIRASRNDWRTAPCPALAEKDEDTLAAFVKMRMTRERLRWRQLGLTTEITYPWLRR